MIKNEMINRLPCGRCDNISGHVSIVEEKEYYIIRFICDNCGKLLSEEIVPKKLSI